jgi:hypothetical protein
MVVTVRTLQDDEFMASLIALLKDSGFDPTVQGDHVLVTGAGVGLGDHSVDLLVRLLSLDDVRIVHFESLLRSPAGPFEAAVLSAGRGNGACVIPKFEVVEQSASNAGSRFRVKATLNLFADHVSAHEFRVMLHLFLKEVDAIDNELANIISERGEGDDHN